MHPSTWLYFWFIYRVEDFMQPECSLKTDLNHYFWSCFSTSFDAWGCKRVLFFPDDAIYFHANVQSTTTYLDFKIVRIEIYTGILHNWSTAGTSARGRLYSQLGWGYPLGAASISSSFINSSDSGGVVFQDRTQRFKNGEILRAPTNSMAQGEPQDPHTLCCGQSCWADWQF